MKTEDNGATTFPHLISERSIPRRLRRGCLFAMGSIHRSLLRGSLLSTYSGLSGGIACLALPCVLATNSDARPYRGIQV